MIRIGDKVIDQLSFPDGALNIKIPEVDNLLVSWHYQNDSELFTLICLRKHFKNYPMALYMPYCPHARMDRVKSAEDCFTLKHFCEVINSLEFSEVYIEDPHSNVAPALLNNCITVQPFTHLENAMAKIENNEKTIQAKSSRKGEPNEKIFIAALAASVITLVCVFILTSKRKAKNEDKTCKQ